jgi:hypothetical protein
MRRLSPLGALLASGCGPVPTVVTQADLEGVWVVEEDGAPVAARVLRPSELGFGQGPAEEYLYDASGAQRVRVGFWGLADLDEPASHGDFTFQSALLITTSSQFGGYPDVFGTENQLRDRFEGVVAFDGERLDLITEWTDTPVRYVRRDVLP